MQATADAKLRIRQHHKVWLLSRYPNIGANKLPILPILGKKLLPVLRTSGGNAIVPSTYTILYSVELISRAHSKAG